MTEFRLIEDLLDNVFKKGEFILTTLSGPLQANQYSKIVIRPLQIKGKTAYQATENRGEQAFHQNFSEKECVKYLKEQIKEFKQTMFYTASADYHILGNKKGHVTLLKKRASKTPLKMAHNRQKEYFIREGIPVPFLVELGVMNAQGKVYPAKQDKFRQINRFLEMIEDLLPHFDPSRPVRIVDFGCGKAYLTFALFHFFKELKGYQVELTGIDLKKEVIQHCQELADALGYQQGLRFVLGSIDNYQTEGAVDMVVSLHACDIATDAALEKAIRWEAKVILSVPCCQHELMSQIRQEALAPLLKHGILKERFAALATDAARAQLLEVLDYQAQILEFIDLEHTPKNLLIRAVKRSRTKGPQKAAEQKRAAWDAYLNFKNTLHIQPSLESRFQAELTAIKEQDRQDH